MKTIVLLILLSSLSCITTEDYIIRVKTGQKIEFQKEEYSLRYFQIKFEKFIEDQKEVKDKIYLKFLVEDNVDVFFMKEVKKSIRNHFNYINVIVYSPIGKESIVRFPPNSNTKVDPSKLKKRNLLNLTLSEEGKIYIDSISDSNEFKKDIKKLAYDFLRNEKKDPNLPEMRLEFIEGIGEVRVASKSIIALYSSRKTKYIDYSEIYSQLKEVYEKIWNEDSKKYFEKKYNDLTPNQKNKIKRITPYVLSEI